MNQKFGGRSIASSYPPDLLNLLSPVRKKSESSSQFPIYLTTCFKTVETSAQRISAFG